MNKAFAIAGEGGIRRRSPVEAADRHRPESSEARPRARPQRAAPAKTGPDSLGS